MQHVRGDGSDGQVGWERREVGRHGENWRKSDFDAVWLIDTADGHWVVGCPRGVVVERRGGREWDLNWDQRPPSTASEELLDQFEKQQ